MVNNGKATKKSVLIVVGTLFALFLAAAIVIAGAEGDDLSSRLNSLLGRKTHEEVSFFMKNDHGTYNLVELSIPCGSSEKYPVVLMAHGFAGTLHSGGATELGARLAERGVLACRIDFDPYMEPSKSAARTHEYPLSQMRDDAVKLLGIVVSEYGGDPENISLYGRSYGGRLVMTMANESDGGYDYKKLALVAPAGDAVAFQRYLGGDKKYVEMKKQAFQAEMKKQALQTEMKKQALQTESAPTGTGADSSSESAPSIAHSGTGTEGGTNGAAESGAGGVARYPEKLGVYITPEWFEDVESYDPTEYGWKFGNKPVLLFYNTLDKVVFPDTSIRCAEAYKNHEIVEVTTEDGHGYEMGYKRSELKDDIMDKLVEFMAG